MTPLRIVMDFEASALNDGYPIEVGIAFTWADGKITSDAKLIRHDPWLEHGRWCESAEAVHNITKDEVRVKGEDPRRVCDWLNSMLVGQVVYADHEKDKGWLAQLFDAAKRRPQFELHHVVEVIDSADYVNETCLVDFTRGRYSGPDVHRAGPDAVRISRALAACCVTSAPA